MTAAKRQRTDGLSPEARRFRRARRATVSFGYVIDDQLVIVGSGVAVSGFGRGVVVTAHHVLAGAGSGLRVLVHGRAFRQGNDWSLDAKFVDLPDNKVTLNAGHDITLMRIDHDFRNRTVALKSNIRLAEGDRIGACGWPFGTKLHPPGAVPLASCLSGVVSLVYPHPRVTIQQGCVVQIPANPGNSGGPVFELSTGSLVGVVSRRAEPSPDDEELGIPITYGMVFVTPTALLREVVADYKRGELSI